MNQINMFEANQVPLFSDLDKRYSEPDNESKTAFEKAIASGRLSLDKNATNFVGHYMYMGIGKGGDAFKHRLTRIYID